MGTSIEEPARKKSRLARPGKVACHTFGRNHSGRHSPEGCLRRSPAVAKAEGRISESPMVAIFTILVFLVVIGGLNFFEFGRID